MPKSFLKKGRLSKQKYYPVAKEKMVTYNKGRRHKTQEWFRELKKTFKCARCSESDPCTFDFHHVDPTQKTIGIAQMLIGHSKKSILAEITKCIVLCANCHRKLHRDLDEQKLRDNHEQ
jgi:hypothetical protein